ncbi:hypothetical protein MED92_02221 [Oceanospirillum sp. MED92]|uniref:Uncharacterized protein n=1 Tax=Neptuniibacter caesariensis TaxID=207954 RepID=A0A7U8C3U6_NEPCE|nr:hypothetical protein MED92_02221 [Oceanospirillum sp. MED92] [Neptuniibacter caesariensis]
MSSQTDEPTSCSKCLKRFLDFSGRDKKDWEQLGRGKAHCDACIEALKNNLCDDQATHLKSSGN